MLQMGEAIVRSMETVRRPGSFHPGLSMIFSENRFPLFGIMLLELLDRLRPDDDHVLAEAALELGPVGAPPGAVERVGHDLEDDDLVMADLAVLGPQALGRGAGECGEPAEAPGELRPHDPVRFRREVVAVVVVERQEELGEGQGPGTNGSAARFRSMRAILGLAGLALVLSASAAAALAEVPLPPPRPEGIAEEAAAHGDVPLPPVRPHGIENEHPSVDGSAAIGAATQPE